ncbi:hypothetical protein SAMN05444166_5013 [Singulisphaera sp. GP187]|uniref:hypothetical protein n=1 Tax=Singulisphaera sp. GP187 TaxID=1882752 RepID=UPI00092AB93A|nr:hypothetical protein [Singulisphaera sp. GP187]SIO47053.1 hypothetical protein SAMN05444166_5013 [Singulisphaera sp. GP187]
MAIKFPWLGTRRTISLGLTIVAFGLAVFTAIDANADATIGYPQKDEDITSEASNLVATGDLLDAPIGTVVLYDADGNPIWPTYVFGDFEYLGYWFAYFPPLPPGVYVLHVEDIYGIGETARGIYVGP